MTLVFCCPTCGATLRVPPAATPSAVACPQCGDAIRVPRAAHPVEAGEDVSAVSPEAAVRARAGARCLSASVWLFGLGAVGLLSSLTLRLAVAGRAAEVPDWTTTLILAAVAVWAGCGVLGGALRAVGYSRFQSALHPLGLDAWCRAAAVGGLLTAAGVACVTPRVLGPGLPPVLAAVLLIGLACGLLGTVLEFAFLPALHRLLADAAGWQAAARTNSYAVSFVFAVVSSMAVLGGGLVVTVLAYGGKANQPGALQSPPPEVRVAVALTLSGLIALVGLACVRYARLLAHTRRSLAAPQPYPDAPVPHPKA